MIENILEILQKKVSKENYPKHMILNCRAFGEQGDEAKETASLIEACKAQAELNVPVVGLNIGSPNKQDGLLDFLQKLLDAAKATKTRVSIFGKWYSLRGDIVIFIKKVIQETQDYDSFFLNLFVNYDAREEIFDACRVMLLKAYDGKTDINGMKQETIKSNLYTSDFIPPDLVIETERRLTGTMLWDSVGSVVFCANKPLQGMTKQDIIRAIEYYAK